MRRKHKPDLKNRKLDEFLSALNLEDNKKTQIMEFVEKLTFEKIKEAGKKSSKPSLRLKY